MGGLLEYLIPVIILAIWIISIIRKATESQRRRQEGGESGEKRPASPWRILTDKDELRRMLEEAQKRGAKPPERPDQAPPESAPFAARGAPGMPAGRVTPKAPRRPAKHRRLPPAAPEKKPKRPVGTRMKTPSVAKREFKTSTFASDKRTFEGALEKRMEARAAKRRPEPVTAARKPPAAPTARPAPEPAAAPAREALVPQLSRANLRRAIVMSEVLGPPLGIKGPRF
ncbi:MAG: hypothetical protein ACYTAN_10730 [Planctomycetota bacterium]|jgi:hypothetical protein